MNAGMELMGMKECRECGDPYTPAEPDTGVCSCCIMSHEVAALRARVAELERVQDAAFRDAHRAEADAARLREALTQVRDAMLATGQEPDGDDDPRRPVAAAVWRALASAPSAEATRNQCDGCAAGRPVDAHGMHRMSDGDGFASNYQQCQAHRYAEPTPRAKAEAFFAGFAGDDDAGVLAWSEPSAEPTPRDMRVACHAWNHGFTKGREYEALDTLEAMQRVGEFTLGEGIDLAAVVAKAVGT